MMKPAIYVGIDPGLSGGLCILGPDDEVQVFATPTVGEKPRQYLEGQMRGLLLDAMTLGRVKAGIERQHAMPGQGVTSMFHVGEGYGLWRGLLAGLSIPYEVMTTQVWRSKVGLPQKSEGKGGSVALASRIFPSIADELVGPRGGFRDGPAEAALIAEARRRIG